MQIYDKIRQMKSDKQAREKAFELEMANCDEEIRNYVKTSAKFSKFDEGAIKRILVKLMNAYEGEEHIATQVTYSFSRYFDIHGGYFKEYTNEPLIIVAQSKAKDSYDDDDDSKALIPLIISGDAIVLCDIYYEGCSIYFYSSCGQDINFHGDIRVSYVRDFIDMVIEYRISNNLEEIDEETLERLLVEFISKNETAINEHQSKKASSSDDDVKRLTKTNQE